MRAGYAVTMGLGAVAAGALGFWGWLLSLPPAPGAGAAPELPDEESAAILAALEPPRRARPVIAIIGANEGTETNDYLMPYGILKRAGVADVVALATRQGPVELFPVFRVAPEATVAEFDARHPEGADYVIVPAMRRQDDPAVLGWITAQSAKGAKIIAVCAGARVLAATGLLDGKRATTHWFHRKKLLAEHPAIRWVADRRLVVDGPVATTTGISASIPMSLTLIQAIAGRERAEAVARDLGVSAWDARHHSDAFRFTRRFALTSLTNTVAFWTHEELSLELTPGVDEVSLAIVADAWSRTFRSRAVIVAGTPGPHPTRDGIRIYPDRVGRPPPSAPALAPIVEQPPAVALESALSGIEARYGARTAEVVAMQLEYAWRPSALDTQ